METSDSQVLYLFAVKLKFTLNSYFMSETILLTSNQNFLLSLFFQKYFSLFKTFVERVNMKLFGKLLNISMCIKWAETMY